MTPENGPPVIGDPSRLGLDPEGALGQGCVLGEHDDGHISAVLPADVGMALAQATCGVRVTITALQRDRSSERDRLDRHVGPPPTTSGRVSCASRSQYQ